MLHLGGGVIDLGHQVFERFALLALAGGTLAISRAIALSLLAVALAGLGLAGTLALLAGGGEAFGNRPHLGDFLLRFREFLRLGGGVLEIFRVELLGV